MGCDIHFVVEVKNGNRWMGVASTDHIYYPESKHRNYGFFDELAGVRCEGSGRQPLGVPKDVSTLTKMCLKNWGADAHSESYMTAEEFAACYAKSNGDVSSIVGEDSIFEKCFGREFCGEEKKYRIVFWFDN